MTTSRTRGPIRAGRRAAGWAGIAAWGLLGALGCQAEYAGMTLPSGHYLYDDVQYFAPGPDFPWANTLAATQRAKMQAAGIEPFSGPPGAVPVPPGVTPPGVPGPGMGGPPVGAPMMGIPGGEIRQAPGGQFEMVPDEGRPPLNAMPAERMNAPAEVPPPGF